MGAACVNTWEGGASEALAMVSPFLSLSPPAAVGGRESGQWSRRSPDHDVNIVIVHTGDIQVVTVGAM